MDAINNEQALLQVIQNDRKQGGQPTWTATEEIRAAALWAAGWSGSQIANELGKSRNAVIGKISRLGLRRGDGIQRRKNPLGVRAAIKSAVRRYKRAETLPPIEIPASMMPIECRNVDFLDLQDHHCRFPLDEKGEYGISKFCGNDKWGSHSYCLPHAQLVYDPNRGRRR